MPTYTVRKKDSDSDHEWDITCSYTEFVETCEEYNLERVFKPMSFITGKDGSTMKAAGNEWNNRLTKIKNDHPGSKIRT